MQRSSPIRQQTAVPEAFSADSTVIMIEYTPCQSSTPETCLYHGRGLTEDELTDLADTSIVDMKFSLYAQALDALAELQEDLRIEDEMTADFVLIFPTDDENPAEEDFVYDLPLMRTIRLQNIGEGTVLSAPLPESSKAIPNWNN